MVNAWTRVGAVVGSLYAARRYFSNWGTTKAEATAELPGDHLVGSPVVQTTEGVWIDASAGEVWPWLVQMGQDRGGLYGFETLENLMGLKYHNAEEIHPGWQHLAVGDAVRLIPEGWMGLRNGLTMQVVDVEGQQCIVLRTAPPEHRWEAVWSFHLIPHWDDRCRLLIRSRIGLRHPGEVIFAEMIGPARAFITRGILIGVKRRAECVRQAEASAATTADDLHHRVDTTKELPTPGGLAAIEQI
jgi:hypothetical protein